VITRRTVGWLGLSQLISWGITYYLIGGFGDAIGSDLGWSRDVVYGGFSAALLVMALASRPAGRMIDRHGGRRVMVVGSLGNAAGCLGLALAHGVVVYYAAWIVLGVAMRLTLYDAAFAALARIAGAGARRAMAQITLLGGLASTVLWPLGDLIAARVGWRGAMVAYAGLALATIPLHLALPRATSSAAPGGAAAPAPATQPLAVGRRDARIAGALYAAIAILASFLNAGMSSQMINILAGLGVAASTAVWIATLRGVGQASARLAEVLFGRRVDPLRLHLLASLGLPLSFALGLFAGRSGLAALGFALLYGATNGILTITRGTLPLVLFDPRSYGVSVGRLLAPSFGVSAAAPVLYAWTREHTGAVGTLVMSLAAGGLIAVAAIALAARFAGRPRPRSSP
jgi:predicted MFS family arabinose efflux permease